MLTGGLRTLTWSGRGAHVPVLPDDDPQRFRAVVTSVQPRVARSGSGALPGHAGRVGTARETVGSAPAGGTQASSPQPDALSALGAGRPAPGACSLMGPETGDVLSTT